MPLQNEWLRHFEKLHSQHQLHKEQNEIITHLKDVEKTKDKYKELDQPITENELFNAAKKLKMNKAVYNDRISNEIIKFSVTFLSLGYVKLFNNILTSGRFPKKWTEGLISPIYKSGNSLDPNNY
jgi:hypothetical protein